MGGAKANAGKTMCDLGDASLLGFRGLDKPFQSGHLLVLNLDFPQLRVLATPGQCLLDDGADEAPDCAAASMDAVEIGCEEAYERPCYLGNQLQSDGAHEDVLGVANHRFHPLRITTDVRSDNSSSYHLRDELQDLGLRRDRGPVLKYMLVSSFW